MFHRTLTWFHVISKRGWAVWYSSFISQAQRGFSRTWTCMVVDQKGVWATLSGTTRLGRPGSLHTYITGSGGPSLFFINCSFGANSTLVAELASLPGAGLAGIFVGTGETTIHCFSEETRKQRIQGKCQWQWGRKEEQPRPRRPREATPEIPSFHGTWFRRSSLVKRIWTTTVVGWCSWVAFGHQNT